MTAYALSVYGHRPVPQGSMVAMPARKPGGRPWTKASNDKALKAWRKVVTAQARVAGARPRTPLAQPVQVSIAFRFKRPANQYHQRKLGPVLREDAPQWCDTVTTGDLDKLTRAVFDALTDAGWWDDDTRACRMRDVVALWGEADELHVHLEPLEHRHAVVLPSLPLWSDEPNEEGPPLP